MDRRFPADISNSLIIFSLCKDSGYIDPEFGEGRLVIMAPKEEAEGIVETLIKCPYSADAAIIGEVIAEEPGRVIMETEIGTQALLPQPGGELLPRIC